MHPLFQWKEIALLFPHRMGGNVAINASWRSEMAEIARKSPIEWALHAIGLLPWLPHPPL